MKENLAACCGVKEISGLLLQGEEKIKSNQKAHKKPNRLFKVNQSLYIKLLLMDSETWITTRFVAALHESRYALIG